MTLGLIKFGFDRPASVLGQRGGGSTLSEILDFVEAIEDPLFEFTPEEQLDVLPEEEEVLNKIRIVSVRVRDKLGRAFVEARSTSLGNGNLLGELAALEAIYARLGIFKKAKKFTRPFRRIVKKVKKTVKSPGFLKVVGAIVGIVGGILVPGVGQALGAVISGIGAQAAKRKKINAEKRRARAQRRAQRIAQEEAEIQALFEETNRQLVAAGREPIDMPTFRRLFDEQIKKMNEARKAEAEGDLKEAEEDAKAEELARQEDAKARELASTIAAVGQVVPGSKETADEALGVGGVAPDPDRVRSIAADIQATPTDQFIGSALKGAGQIAALDALSLGAGVSGGLDVQTFPGISGLVDVLRGSPDELLGSALRFGKQDLLNSAAFAGMTDAVETAIDRGEAAPFPVVPVAIGTVVVIGGVILILRAVL